MLPPALTSTYKLYKQDTDYVATWLAQTAKAHGYPNALSEAVDMAKTSSKRLKGKARKEAKDRGASRSMQTQKTQHYTLALQDFVPLAAFIANRANSVIHVPGLIMSMLDRVIEVRTRFGQQLKEYGTQTTAQENIKHQHFIQTLAKVRDTLKPCTRSSPSPSAAAKAPREGLNGVEPSFGALSVSESPQNLLDALSIGNPKSMADDGAVYEAEPQTSFEGAIVAYTMMMNDIQDIRSRIRWIWENYKKGLFTLSAAAVATDTAIDLARNIAEEVTPLFKNHNGIPGMIHSFFQYRCILEGYKENEIHLSEEENFNYDLYEIADEVYMNAFRILHGFTSTSGQSDVPIYKDGTFGTYDPASDRSLKTGRQRFIEDQILLMEFFTELITVVRCIPGYPVKDGFLCGMGELNKTGAIPFYLIFAAQVFLDIHHILRSEAAVASEKVLYQVARMDSELGEHLKFHTNLKIDGWPASNDIIIRELRKSMKRINGDPVYQARIKVLQRAGRPISSCAKPHHILRRSPVLSGLMLYHFQVQFRSAGISVTNAWGSTIYVAHLYNALHNEKLLKRQWHGMDVAQTLLREESFYIGGRPRDKEGYLQEFCLRLGMDKALFKKPIQDQRRPISLGSGAETRMIKDGIPVSSEFRSRYLGNAERVDWTPELIDGIISLGEFEQVGSEEEGTLQFISIPDAEELKRKRKQHHKKPTSAGSMQPENLVRDLMLNMQNESLELQFPYLLLHRICWQLLQQVREHCDALLSKRYGSKYLERENQLPLLVGYILGAAVGMDYEPMQAAADAMNEMNGFFDAANNRLEVSPNTLSKSEEFRIAEDGIVDRISSSTHAETNVAIWSPADPAAFNKARDASMFTRLGTRHSHQEIKMALETTPDVDQTFCLSVNNVILVFSASHDEHTMHCQKVLQMLEDRSMRANIYDCVFDSEKCIDVGIQLEQVGHNKVYMVINKGVQGRS